MRFSLGAAIWGFVPAPGHYGPTQQAPYTWLVLLARKHADSEVFSGIFSANRAGRVWVLENAPSARFIVSNASDRRWRKGLNSIRLALGTRGALPSATLPTILVVVYHRQDQEFLLEIPRALAGVGQKLTGFEIGTAADSKQREPTWAPDVSECVAGVAARCQGLASLRLAGVFCRLPDPAQLTSLTDLNIEVVGGNPDNPESRAASMCRSVAAVVQQLTAAHISASAADLMYGSSPALSARAAARVLAQSASALTHLTVAGPLTDPLLHALVTNAAKLEQLSVDSLIVQTDKHSESQWQLQRLQVGVVAPEFEMLCRLPTRAEGQTQLVCSSVTLNVRTSEVLEPANLQRLQRWNYDSQRILIRARSQLPAAEHPAALAAAVQHVSSLTAAACSLVLDGDWHWCADTAQAVGPRLGALDSGFTVCVSLPSPPEPDVLVTVGQLGDAVQRLTVGTLQCSFAVSGCTRASHELMGTFVSSLPDNDEGHMVGELWSVRRECYEALQDLEDSFIKGLEQGVSAPVVTNYTSHVDSYIQSFDETVRRYWTEIQEITGMADLLESSTEAQTRANVKKLCALLFRDHEEKELRDLLTVLTELTRELKAAYQAYEERGSVFAGPSKESLLAVLARIEALAIPAHVCRSEYEDSTHRTKFLSQHPHLTGLLDKVDRRALALFKQAEDARDAAMVSQSVFTRMRMGVEEGMGSRE